MRNAKLLFPYLALLLSSCVVIPTYKEHASLNQIRHYEQNVPVNNVLLIGTGPVASRVFLDNLYTEMAQSFKQKGVQSDFSYAGNIQYASSLKLDRLASAPYDTYLVLRAYGNPTLNMTKGKYTAIGLVGTATAYGNQYTDTYTVTLYHRNDKPQMVWQGNLEVDVDLADDSRYKKIARLLFEELAKSNILP